MHPLFIPPNLPSKHPLPHPSHPSHPPKRIRQTPHQTLPPFHPTPFIPYPSPNPHLQTILSNFYPGAPHVHYTRISLRTTDRQTTIQLDLASATTLAPFGPELLAGEDGVLSVSKSVLVPDKDWPKAGPVAVVLHGLESNADAIVTRRIVAALTESKFKVVAMNFRSCAVGEEMPETLRLYHAGFTEDLETVLDGVRDASILAQFRPPDVYLCGFSLGANVMCLLLGRGRVVKERFGVVAAAGACVPFDPTACQKWLDWGWRGVLYSRRLVGSMQSKFRLAREKGVDVGACDRTLVERADRIGKIDDAYIAPVFGFKDRFDYYQKVDARKVLKYITVPTLLINARDDPFFDHYSGHSLPTKEHIADAPVLFHLTEHGGHCGFLDKSGFQQSAPCYFQREFARFFVHVRDANIANEQSTPRQTN